jgi:tricarballylate dehydrogenase
MPSNLDVVVVGGGNAALCAAIAAKQAGAKVLVLERSPIAWRGGNSKYTRNLRCVNDGAGELPGRYEEDEFLDDLARVAAGEPYDLDLARLLVARSRDTPAWMERLGVRWQRPLTGTLQLSHSNRFFLGGGKALVNHYYRVLERLGVKVAYESRVTGFRLRAGACQGVVVAGQGGNEIVPARSVVVASGGFESDKGWLAQTWGETATAFAIRGCAYNDGSLIQALLELGARSVASPGVFHGTAVDRRSPEYDGGIATRVDSIPFGIVVDRNARRFYDEGEDLWPKRYAIWGRLIAEQEGAAAFSIFDSRSVGRFIPPLYSPVSASTFGELAAKLGLDPDALARTVAEFNAGAAANQEADIDATRLDGCCTEGVEPRKSNWALPLERPPYHAFPLRTGVTFTYFGAGVDDRARIVTADGGRLAGLYAAGEVMAGNILQRGYIAGVGMTIGTVFGRLAGEEAARDALR